MKATKPKVLGNKQEEKNYDEVVKLLNQVYELGYKAGKSNLPQHKITIDNKTGKLSIE